MILSRAIFSVLWAASILASHVVVAQQQPLIEQQRHIFREVYAAAELGDWRPATQHESLLRQYVLWPDLRAAWLRTRVRNSDYTGVEGFLEQYGVLKPARELRYHYALSLGKQARHADYLTVYQQYYQGLEIARLDCIALQAELAAGHETRIINRGLQRWLVGRNQVDECDPVFAHLRHRGVIGEQQYRDRFDLAVEARQFSLARYLARSLPGEFTGTAKRWTETANDPATFLEHHSTASDGKTHRQQLAYAAERLAYKTPAVAAGLWRSVVTQYPFSSQQKNHIARHIALWSARRHEHGAYELLSALPPQAVDIEVYRWRARTALKRHDWPAVIEAISAMPDDEQAAEQWRYWLANAYRQTGSAGRATQLFAELAAERSFYGFLSADAVGKTYTFGDDRLSADEAAIRDLQRHASLIRARELFLVGLEGRGRSEWDATVAYFSADQKLQASILAHRWGWHSRAIAMAAEVGQFDDLQLRYPLPYRETFEKYATAAKVRHSWAYGVARSESLFMRDIRSSAGAIGLMQLMPATGRLTASELKFPYSGFATLVDPDSNIRLGTAYLAMMLRRFNDNPLLATAAYNAGPANVEAWLPQDGSIEGLIWLENIPYNETRDYVRRVLATDTIFQWRLTGRWQRLSPQLTKIRAVDSALRVADSSSPGGGNPENRAYPGPVDPK